MNLLTAAYRRVFGHEPASQSPTTRAAVAEIRARHTEYATARTRHQPMVLTSPQTPQQPHPEGIAPRCPRDPLTAAQEPFGTLPTEATRPTPSPAEDAPMTPWERAMARLLDDERSWNSR